MDPELLLDRFTQKIEKLGDDAPHINGEVILQGSRAEIIFIPEAPRSDDEQKIRKGVSLAIQAACSAETGGAHTVDPQLGHIAIANVTASDIGTLNSLPGVMFRQTIV